MPQAEPASGLEGLSSADVAERRAEGRVNDVETRTSRSVLDIVRANLLTRFNAIVSVLAVIVLVLGDPIDALFGLVMVANIIIGIAQEVRAKRTLDGLQVLIAPTVVARRDGVATSLPVDQLVIDDVLELVVGDQIPVDGEVAAAIGCEVDESALTGESKPVPKKPGDDVRSGSAVVAGTATVVATRVGTDAWIHQLVREAKEFVLTRSELRAGVDRILWGVSWLLPPLALLLFWSQLRDDAPFAEGMVSATAGVVALVPQGLVLLVSMAMAVAVIGLARRSVVVQELPAVEGLARADVVCLDKTGTLTTGRTHLEKLVPVGATDLSELRLGLAALAGSEVTPTAAMKVIGPEVGPAPGWDVVSVVPFSSERKWSSATFSEGTTWVLGAPEVLLDAMIEPEEIEQSVSQLAATARRVLLVATAAGRPDPDPGPVLPPVLRPSGLVVLAEEVRPDAAETMRYFRDQGVDVKVISGDNADTVAAVARQLQLPGVDAVVDLRSVETITPDLAEETTIFGRVLPEQKRELVTALQARGHVVAMTGDGVNDIPALKAADIGIGMDTATSATKAVSQLVLLNGRFDLLPSVVAEGRRVVANMERVSSLFVAKTVYAAIFALVVGVGGFAFPFLPRHLTLIDSLTIGIPAFVLSFRAAEGACRPGYLGRVLRFAVPAGLAGAMVTLLVYAVARQQLDLPLDESRTLATLTLGGIGFWILYQLIKPVDRLEVGLLSLLVALFAAVFAWPFAADFYALERPDFSSTSAALALLVGAAIVFQAVLWVWRRTPQLREMTFVPSAKRASRTSSGWNVSMRRHDDDHPEAKPAEEDSGSGRSVGAVGDRG